MGPSIAVLHGGVGEARWCFNAPLVGCPLHVCFLICFSGLFLSVFDFFLAGGGDVATKTELCGKTVVTPPK